MKKLLSIVLFIFISSVIFAGDVATFVNLGFSQDGKYFLFGEYGIDDANQSVYSNMWLVDVLRNSFVPKGVYSGKYKTVIEPGESALGGLIKLLSDGQGEIKKYKIDYLEQGRPLYVRINDDNNVNELNFRDFVTGLSYHFILSKKITGEGVNTESSFGITLETKDKNEKVKKYSIGNPNYSRKGVTDYKIERILHSSEGSNLIIVLSKYVLDGNDINIRYMVETISLK